MIERLKNEFTLDVQEDGGIVATRVFADKYDDASAVKLIQDTFDFYFMTKKYVDTFEEQFEVEMKRVREENPDREEVFFEKISEGWRNKFNIDKEQTLPELIKELPQYIKVADKLQLSVPNELREL